MTGTVLESPTGNALDWLAERSGGRAPRGSVLFFAPSRVFQAPGGGENQLTRTGMHLHELGVDVRLFNPWTDSLRGARLLHTFGMSREGLELARVARASGVAVVVSPICWYEPRAIAALASGYVASICDLGKWAAQWAVPRWPRWRRELLGLADAVLPNSRAEASQLVRLFAIDPARVRVIPNGVEPRFAAATPDLWRSRYGDEPFVLYTGRIEPRKNVLGQVKACRAAGLPLTLIGDAPAGLESYARACRAEGGAGVRWLPAVSHDSAILASAYASARVLTLATWFETPGLSALEGASAGASLVVTPYGSAREYFGDLAVYARPDRPAEVVAALQRAWRDGPDPGLASHVGGRFSWSEVARQTAGVYDEVAG